MTPQLSLRFVAGDRIMEDYQWFFLGVMVAWTPSLVVLALMLRGFHPGQMRDDNLREFDH